MANSNPLKAAWSEGRTTFGLWMTVPGSIGAEILAGAAVGVAGPGFEPGTP
jgi:2-keto-3-deoxy-L-rhamnonate aldolase RhmA